jgi:beta-glucosidase
MKYPSLVLFSITLLTLGLSKQKLPAETPTNYAIQPVPRAGNWMNRHATFNAISQQGEAELVFLGDSITQGWEKKGAEVWKQSYGDRKAANFGIGGDRTEHVLWRLANGNYDGLSPKLTVLMIGTNNTGHDGRPFPEIGDAVYHSSAEQTAEGVKQIVETLRSRMPDMKILLLGIFPRGETPEDPKRQKNEAINAKISKLADDEQVHYMDIGDTFLQPDGTLSRDIMPDLLHLNEQGYAMWAEAIEPKVKELLGEGQ